METLKIGDKITLTAKIKLGQPFFKFVETGHYGRIYKPCLCAVYEIDRSKGVSKYEEYDFDITRYFYAIVHTYKEGEFVPGLNADVELEKYCSLNREHALESINNDISYIDESLKKVNCNLNQSEGSFIERVGCFYKEASSYGLSKNKTQDELKDRFRECQKEWGEEKTNLEKSRLNHLEKVKLVNDKKIVWENWKPGNTVNSMVMDDKTILCGTELFLTSNNMIKHQIGKDYKQVVFEDYVLCTSPEIKHEIGEEVYVNGGMDNQGVVNIDYIYKNNIDWPCHQSTIEYRGYRLSSTGPQPLITDEEFEYSDKILKMLNEDE